MDVWQYITREGIALPSLYFAHPRRVFRRGSMLMAESEHLPLLPGEAVEARTIRFRTVGDITCTAPVDSAATTIDEIVRETELTTITERGATRLDDQANEAAMELRKREGYF
jgi:sulfate adenylyltransferase subunit 2